MKVRKVVSAGNIPAPTMEDDGKMCAGEVDSEAEAKTASLLGGHHPLSAPNRHSADEVSSSPTICLIYGILFIFELYTFLPFRSCYAYFLLIVFFRIFCCLRLQKGRHFPRRLYFLQRKNQKR